MSGPPLRLGPAGDPLRDSAVLYLGYQEAEVVIHWFLSLLSWGFSICCQSGGTLCEVWCSFWVEWIKTELHCRTPSWYWRLACCLWGRLSPHLVTRSVKSAFFVWIIILKNHVQAQKVDRSKVLVFFFLKIGGKLSNSHEPRLWALAWHGMRLNNEWAYFFTLKVYNVYKARWKHMMLKTT